MTDAQAAAWSYFRDSFRATGYEMPADHHHSPNVVIGIGEFFNEYEREYVTVVCRFHPDGRREAVTDYLNRLHFATDARNDGRRI